MLHTEMPCFYAEMVFARERNGNQLMLPKDGMTTYHASLCVGLYPTQPSIYLMALGWWNKSHAYVTKMF